MKLFLTLLPLILLTSSLATSSHLKTFYEAVHSYETKLAQMSFHKTLLDYVTDHKYSKAMSSAKNRFRNYRENQDI